MSRDAIARSREGEDPLAELLGRLSAAEQALIEQNRRLAVTYEHATVGIAETDAEGRRMRVNATACAIQGGGVRLTGFFGLTLSGLFFRRGLGDDSLRPSDSGGSDGSLFTQTAAACVAGSLGDDQGHARVMQ